MVEWLFLAVLRGCLQFVIVVFPDHTHLLFLHNNQGVNLSASTILSWLEGQSDQDYQTEYSGSATCRRLILLLVNLGTNNTLVGL